MRRLSVVLLSIAGLIAVAIVTLLLVGLWVNDWRVGCTGIILAIPAAVLVCTGLAADL